jgi:hypothetical protein
MRLRDDERGQSVQIGAVLLFATLIIAFSSYQAFVVPQQNEEIEFNHNQQVQDEMQDLRNAVVSMSGGGSATATSLTLGTTYPSRAIAQNPGPASGSLRTAGTENELVNLSIRNATADGETGDVWDGSRRSYNTGAILYDPAYNRYGEAPRTTYEHSVLYNEFRSGTIVKSGQGVVDGRTLSLVVVNGSLSRTATGATSVDVRPVSSSTETVLVRAPDGDSPVTVNFTSRLPASRWQELLGEEDNVRSVTQHPAVVSGPFHAVQVKLEPDVAYRLQLTKVGVGTGVTDEDPDYLTDEDGEGATVTRGESQRVTLSVRDDLNNPVSDVTVNASVGSGKGSFADGTKSTDGDGEVAFEYETTGSTETGTHRLNFTTNDSSVLSTRPFDQSRPKNVSMDVTVTESSGGGGAGAYTVTWKNPEETSGNSGAALSSCSDDACTWDVDGSSSDTLELNATLTPSYEGVNVDFAVSNSTVGTISPAEATTGSGGGARTALTAQNNGSITVLAAGSRDDDVIDITVEGVSSDGSGAGIGGGTATRSGFAFDEAGTREKDELKHLESNGAAVSTFTKPGSPFDARGLGPLLASLDGDTDDDLPWIDNSNYVRTIDANGSTQQFGQSQENSRMGVGDFDGDSTTEVYYATSGNELAKASGSTGTESVDTAYPDARAVAGISDVDGDGSDELVFTTNNDAIEYVEEDGTTITASGFGENLPNGVAVGNPADFNDDGVARIPIVTSSNQIAVVDASDGGSLTYVNDSFGEAAKSPIAATDIDGDSGWEIVFTRTNGELYYMDPDGSITPIVDDDGDQLVAEKENGAV